MTKTASRPGPAPKPADSEKSSTAAAEKPKESFRDLVEQIVVAVILAILIRGFDAEAFVIPTGSMAPTLKGRHKEITCPQCGHVYAVNSSEQAEAYFLANPNERRRESGICGNCRFEARIGDEPNFKGDRILVMKFPYEFTSLPGAGGPSRWDIVVFHYPERPEQNYIKRLVGMPGEDLRIQRGTLFARPSGTDEPFRVLQKPLSRQRAMAILVNDDRHRATLLKDRPEWLRWKTGEGWKETSEGVFAASKQSRGSLRYRHLVPDPVQWAAIAEQLPPRTPPRPTLITDFYSYNSSTLGDVNDPEEAWLQSNWVGDLMLESDLVVREPGGSITFELVEAGVANRCVVDLQTGNAALYHGEQKLGEAATRIRGAGSYAIEFMNVDDRLTLTVDGRTPFGEGITYDDGPGAPDGPTAADLDPVGIATDRASVEVSGLVLKRDIYYTQNPRRSSDSLIPDPPGAFGRMSGGASRVVNLFDVLSNPEKFVPLMGDLEPGETYTIGPDRFVMMGDNSPRSSDSRAWGRLDRDWDDDRASWEVPRELLIGRAFFVYWPHGVPFFPKIKLSRDFRIPFRPYFERMKPIR